MMRAPYERQVSEWVDVSTRSELRQGHHELICSLAHLLTCLLAYLLTCLLGYLFTSKCAWLRWFSHRVRKSANWK